jgi:dihydrolipoamide dehydrogenase
VLRGKARLSGVKDVVVTRVDGEEEVVHARQAVVVATGSEAALPAIDGLRTARPWTSREATSGAHVPATLTIVGGGVVAVEMATLFASLGSAVTVVARSTLLSSLEPFCGDLIARALGERGVRVHLHTGVTRVARCGERVDVTTTDGAVLTSDEVLIATGRQPRTGGLGLEAVGITPGIWLATDDSMRVDGHDWLYAVGDVTGRALLTHQGKYQGRAAAAAIVARAGGRCAPFAPWGDASATADGCAVPQVIFTDPEIATVGLTARDAAELGVRVDVVDYDLGAVSGAGLHADNYTGQARMVVDRARGAVLGLTLAGPDVGELIHSATVAIVGQVPVERLWHAVPAYPTISEVWLRLLESHRRQTR